jgi:aryl carrier-like protein
MSDDPAYAAFCAAVAAATDVDLDGVEPGTALADAGFDSIALVELYEWFADEIGAVPEALWASIDTVGELFGWYGQLAVTDPAAEAT